MTVRLAWLVGVFLVVSLAGCTHHQAPDPALVEQLSAATQATLLTMALPAAQLPSAQEISKRMELVAMHIAPSQEVAVRSGRLDQRALLAEYHSLRGRSTSAGTDHEVPPTLLVFLAGTQTRWSLGQCLLFAGLMHQLAQERGWEAPVTELATGEH